MRALAILGAVTLGACATPVTPQAPLPHTAQSAAPALVPSLTGCSAEFAKSLDQRIQHLDQRARLRSDENDLPRLQRELDEIWQSPCLAHVARVLSVPKPARRSEIEELFIQGLGGALRANVGGRALSRGKRVFAIPPLPLPALSEAALRALGPWLCAASDSVCGARAQSYIERAHRVFDRAELLKKAVLSNQNRDVALCKGVETISADQARTQTPFEAWAGCVISEAPWTHRYAPLRYRAPERGWLVLRGRRGHYEFADEIRAYDLATGAAYVVSSSSALVLSDTDVDHAAVDRGRKPEAFTGKVIGDQVRELAFVLLTLDAVMPLRIRVHPAPFPEGLALTLTSSPRPTKTGPSGWNSSAQTEIAFSLVDQGKLVAEGSFTWPNSSQPAEDHANELIRILESGLERGCAPARLPPGIGSGEAGRVSRLDADPGKQKNQFQGLARTLDGLVSNACPDAK